MTHTLRVVMTTDELSGEAARLSLAIAPGTYLSKVNT